MAWKLGDETALRLGRVSLNPIVHMDPIGTLLFPLIQIFTSVPLLGWAKPTPYNLRRFDWACAKIPFLRGRVPTGSGALPPAV